MQTLESYLVKLGFNVDSVGFTRFEGVLRDASAIVDTTSIHMAKRFIEAQIGITGAFVAIGASALGIADKVAMADQEYRMLALHMYTTTSVARELKISMDALGQPLENIAWDPELYARFVHLIAIQRTMMAELGGGFEGQMRKIRDLRYEVSYFWVELKYLTMYLVEDFGKLLGLDLDQMLQKMRYFNAWFVAHLPQIGDWLENKLIPIFNTIKTTLWETWKAGKQFAGVFVDMIGAISGDKSLQGVPSSFDNISKAIQISIGWMGDFVMGMLHAEEIVMHLVSASFDLAHLDFSGAWKELKAGWKLVTPATGLLSGAAVGGVLGGAVGLLGGPGGIVAGATLGAEVGAALGLAKTPAKEITQVASSMGVPANLALAVAQVESGMRQYGKNGNVLMSSASNSHATGMFQLEPATARLMGVNPNDIHGNIRGGVGYLQQLLAKYHGNQTMALEHYYGSSDPKANAAYASKVMKIEYNFGETHIHVLGSVNPEETANHVVRKVEESHRRKIQQNIAQTNSPAWGY